MRVQSINRHLAEWKASTTRVEGRYYVECFRDSVTLAGNLVIAEEPYVEGTYLIIDGGHEFTPATDKHGCEVLCIYEHGYEEETDNDWVLHPPRLR